MLRYEKYWPYLPDITDPIKQFLQISMSDVVSSDYSFNEGCHGHNIFYKA